jgi:hypothetical protein
MALITTQVEREGDFGEGTVSVDLTEDGGSVAVNNANRELYVTLYVEHLLLKSVEKQRKAFCAGFHKVGSCLLTPGSLWPCMAGAGGLNATTEEQHAPMQVVKVQAQAF